MRIACFRSGLTSVAVVAMLPVAAAQATQVGTPNQGSSDATPPTRVERAADRRAVREAKAAERRRAKAARKSRRADDGDGGKVKGAPPVEGSDIIVTGLRKSVAESVNEKRNATQIVDVITSEDAGKLPDNNVIGALSRIPGISITRSRGQADGFTIRGLDGVQTTVNGTEVASAGGRTLDLSTVPSELVKSIEVYKTRTADQIEGGIGGTVNVQLRRPLDMRKGLTVAGSARLLYREVGSTKSPFGSLLVADRFETGIGEMGLMLNASINRDRYQEATSGSESPSPVCCGPTYPICDVLPKALPVITGVRGWYGAPRGDVAQPAWQHRRA